MAKSDPTGNLREQKEFFKDVATVVGGVGGGVLGGPGGAVVGAAAARGAVDAASKVLEKTLGLDIDKEDPKTT